MIQSLMLRFLLDKEMGLALVGWGLFLSCAALYCLAYNQFVLITSASFFSAFNWGLGEYAPWLLLTPLLFKSLKKIHLIRKNSFVIYLWLTLVCLFVALCYRVGLDIYVNSQKSILASAVYFLPSQLSVLAFSIIIWHLLLSPESLPQAVTSTLEKVDSGGRQVQTRDKVLVMKGNGECLIEWCAVDFISAAGNYMELTSAQEKYLLRISMKQLEQELPNGLFIRIHRSHMVNIAAIERILPLPSGNGEVKLRNGSSLSLSKKYKPALKAYKLS